MKPLAECALTAIIVFSPILLCCVGGAICWAVRYARKNRRKKHMEPKKRGLSDEEVEFEIERLLRFDYVKLARQEANIRNARRNLLYNLRCLEKKGRMLADMGWSPDMADEYTDEVG